MDFGLINNWLIVKKMKQERFVVLAKRSSGVAALLN